MLQFVVITVFKNLYCRHLYCIVSLILESYDFRVVLTLIVCLCRSIDKFNINEISPNNNIETLKGFNLQLCLSIHSISTVAISMFVYTHEYEYVILPVNSKIVQFAHVVCAEECVVTYKLCPYLGQGKE